MKIKNTWHDFYERGQSDPIINRCVWLLHHGTVDSTEKMLLMCVCTLHDENKRLTELLRKMVDYVEEQNAGQWREQAITLEAENERLRKQADQVQHDMDTDGTCSRKWHDAVEYNLRIEIERLRDVARKLEPFALTQFSGGQGRDGKWHDRRTCHVCGAVVEVDEKHRVTGHNEDCVFSR